MTSVHDLTYDPLLKRTVTTVFDKPRPNDLPFLEDFRADFRRFGGERTNGLGWFGG
jgi:hypothetical protein